MKGIKVESMYSDQLPRRLQGTETYLITKSRGKLTLEDVEESMRDYGFEGFVCIVLSIKQDAYAGWNDDDKEKDQVYASLIDEGLDCPVCKQLTPLIEYCPKCGKRIDTLEVD